MSCGSSEDSSSSEELSEQISSLAIYWRDYLSEAEQIEMCQGLNTMSNNEIYDTFSEFLDPEFMPTRRELRAFVTVAC